MYTFIYLFIYMFIYVYVCVYIYIYICVYIYIYIYIHIRGLPGTRQQGRSQPQREFKPPGSGNQI